MLQIVILGGGHSGVEFLLSFKKYAKKLSPFVEITVIDQKDYHENNTAAVKYIVNPPLFDDMAARFTDMFPSGSTDGEQKPEEEGKGKAKSKPKPKVDKEYKIKYLNASVKTVTRDQKVVVSLCREEHEPTDDSAPLGEELLEVPFDYLVVGTGMVYPIFKGLSRRLEDRKAELTMWSQQIAAANRILMVGGGSVCVETAGEIIERYPDKKLVIVHAGTALLDSNAPSARTRAMAFLQSKGVEILLEQRVQFVARYQYTGLPQLVQTNKGAVIETDMILATAGYSLPNTEFLREHHASSLTASGQVAVQPTLQMKGQTNIFALGDVAEIPMTLNLFANILKQSEVVASNVAALLLANLRKANPEKISLVSSDSTSSVSASVSKPDPEPNVKLPAIYKPQYSRPPLVSIGSQFGIFDYLGPLKWIFAGRRWSTFKTKTLYMHSPKAFVKA